MARDATSVTQFGALRWLDEFFSPGDPDELDRRYGAALERLDDDRFTVTGTTVAGVESIEGAAQPAPLTHLADHWLSGQYWPSIGSEVITEAIRAGYREAITDARRERLPLCSIWVCGSTDPTDPVFRVDHVVAPRAVVVTIVSPTPAVR